MYRLRQTADVESVKALHTLCLPGDDWEDASQHWILWLDNTPVGFCSAKQLTADDSVVFLSRAGLLPVARGSGLQRRMIQTRLQWCRSVGAKTVITYTVYDNHASIINLLRCGFKFYFPVGQWAGDVHYFMREL
jgi:GNAT superfamily N-acetyltransferase